MSRSKWLSGCCAVLCSLTLVTAARSAEEAETRLSTDLDPTFQSVRLKLDPDKRSYSGSTRTELEVAKSTTVVQFHAEGSAARADFEQ